MRRVVDEILYRLFLWSTWLFFGIWPDRWLYNVAGGVLYFVLYRVTRYRVDVVRDNLRRSFPEKDAAELREIERKFYRHLSDVFVDTFKLGSISRRNILSRMTYRDLPEHEARVAGQSWFSAMSHFGSWELTINYSLLTDHRVLAVYRPLKNRIFDRYYRAARARFGTEPTPMSEILREVAGAVRAGVGATAGAGARAEAGAVPVAVAMIADQTPPKYEIKHWYRFLGQPTPFFSGFEKISVRYGMPVYFTYIRQTGRRSYEAEFQLIYDGKEKLGEYEITERYVRRLEAMIRETPHLWMWSHRRWKHRPEAEEGRGR